MAKRKAAAIALRDLGTENAIVQIVAQAGGEIDRREIVRRLGQRGDLSASLTRMERRGDIEIIGKETQAGRVNWRVRLIKGRK